MIDTIATWMLEEDHRVILKVITRMATAADDLDHGKSMEPIVLQQFLEFFRVFVEQAHHGKEESVLFGVLEKKGVPANGCPLDMLRNEHRKGRGLVTELANSVSAYLSTGGAGRESLSRGLHRVSAFYASHMWTEDYLLLPMTNKCLSPEDQNSLAEQFRGIEAEIGPDVHMHFEQMAEELDCAVRT